MSGDLKGKRLLVLGANPETTAIVKVAQAMGVYVIVTDYTPGAHAKKYADKAYDVDCMDVDGLVEIARSENVDGVMVGVADTLLKPYQALCERLGMPCFGTAEQMRILSTKDLFKESCEKHGISGVPIYDIALDSPQEQYEQVQYPVLVKPVDNCSGKGMSVCRNPEELRAGIEKGIECSRCGRYMVERFMTCDDLIAYYTIQEGYASLSMLGDRYTYRGALELGPVCLADVYPAKCLDYFIEKYDPRFKSLLSDLGVENGVFLIQMFMEGDTPYVYDPGFRLQGGAQHLNIAAVNGFDQREMLVEFALTGKMGHKNLKEMDDVRLRGKSAGSLWFLLKPGTISSIVGMDKARADSCVVNVLQRFEIGEEITQEMQGTEQQVFARLHIVCEDRGAYKEKIAELMRAVDVLDEHGESMLLWGDFSADTLPDWSDR